MTSAKKKRVLFICSGNYYRSRLAEILFNHEAEIAGLPWVAESRGMFKADGLKGMSPYALSFLKDMKIELPAETPRNPVGIEVEDLIEANLCIGMCREEHQPMVEQKFMALAKKLHQAQRLRYWTIYDIPQRPGALIRLLGGAHKTPSQPAESSTNHVALAIRDLVRELAAAPQPFHNK